MTRFVDQYPPDCMPGYPCVSSPRWNTLITRTASGDESVLQKWQHPLNKYSLPDAVREHAVFEAVRDHWLVMRGPVHTWPFRDPLDFASLALPAPNQAPIITMMDQQIGIGDGATTRFKITKLYQRGVQSYTRNIHLPIVDSVLVSSNGVAVLTGFTVDRGLGEIVFDVAPLPGRIIRCGYLFDVEVRFEDDDVFEGVVASYAASGFADIPLIEVRHC